MAGVRKTSLPLPYLELEVTSKGVDVLEANSGNVDRICLRLVFSDVFVALKKQKMPNQTKT